MMVSLGDQGVTYIGGHTTAGLARRGVLFSDGCSIGVAKNDSVGSLHPSISPYAKRVYTWAILEIEYAGG
jgi:hypothetical protein